MATKDRRKFGTDLTNLVSNPKARQRLTKKSSPVRDDISLPTAKPNPKSTFAKKLAAQSKKATSNVRDFQQNASRLAQLSLDEARPSRQTKDAQLTSTNQPELPYVKIRTYSKKPGKQWAYVENSKKHVSFVNEPLDIEAWLLKEKENKRRSKKL